MGGLKVNITPLGVVVAVGAAVALYGVWRAKSAIVSGVSTAANAVNPLNNENIFYSGVNNVGAAVSGEESWSLGSWLYDITHPPFYYPRVDGAYSNDPNHPSNNPYMSLPSPDGNPYM